MCPSSFGSVPDVGNDDERKQQDTPQHTRNDRNCNIHVTGCISPVRPNFHESDPRFQHISCISEIYFDLAAPLKRLETRGDLGVFFGILLRNFETSKYQTLRQNLNDFEKRKNDTVVSKFRNVFDASSISILWNFQQGFRRDCSLIVAVLSWSRKANSDQTHGAENDHEANQT